jgi:DNA-binding NarL/FixJ family response regulator
MRTLRILLADDHPVLRGGLRALMADTDDLDVVGEAATMPDVIEAAARLRPDVVVMDLRMPGGDGIEATRRIVRARPQTCILVLTMHDDEASVFAAMRAGARGYAVKGSGEEAILSAVRAVGRGEAIFGPAVADRLLEMLADAPALAARAFPELTEREREVLGLIARGLTNTEIANQLYVGEATVKTHVSRVLLKLGLRDRVQAVVFAYECGLVTPGDDLAG